MIQIGYTGTDDDARLWVAIEPIHNRILGVSIISRHRNMPIAESCLRSLIKLYGKHIVYSNDGGSWYPEACKSLGLKHILHSPFEKSIIERARSISRIEPKLSMIIIHMGRKQLIVII